MKKFSTFHMISKLIKSQKLSIMKINIFKNIPKIGNDKKNKQDNESKYKSKSSNIEIKNYSIEKLEVKKIQLTIQNVVLSAKLSYSLNLKEISLQVVNSEYNLKRFTGLIMRINEPK